MLPRKLVIGILICAMALSAILAERVESIPVFARRYQASCSTCHEVIPKLKPFGVAFKKNGYRFPQGDEKYLRVPDTQLGSTAWKDVWPYGFWPGAMSSLPPIALRFILDYKVNPGSRISNAFEFPHEIELLSGGNLGSGVSYFGEIAFEGDEVELERAFLSFDGLLGTKALNLTIGKFEPGVIPFSRITERLSMSDYLISSYRAAANSGTLGSFEQGIELWGSGKIKETKSFEYAAGVLNGSDGSEETDSDKDFYLRGAFKLGGYPIPGRQSDTEESVPQEEAKEKSLKAGLFYLNGTRSIAGTPGVLKRKGVDLHLLFDPVEILASFSRGEDEDPATRKRYSSEMFFVEGEFSVFPWLICFTRFETAYGGENGIRRVVPGVVLSLRPNVKLVGESELYLDRSGDSTGGLRLEFAL